MKIIPAIDLRCGCCVRLLKGDPRNQTVYSENPVEIALQWEEMGAELLHVVDLDGAFSGKTANREVIEEMGNRLKVPFQLGGGLREKEAIDSAFKLGASRVILGTVAVENMQFVKEMVEEFGSSVVVGLDARDGRVAVKGWQEDTEVTALELAERLKEAGVQEIIYTDIQRDGTLEGPNLPSVKELARNTGLSIIVSGGISSVDDLVRVSELEKQGLSIEGVIVGKALYSGNIDFKEALKAVNR